MNNKICVVTYYNIAYGETEPTVTCFNNKENATKYYEYMVDGHGVVSIDECEVYTEFKVCDS